MASLVLPTKGKKCIVLALSAEDFTSHETSNRMGCNEYDVPSLLIKFPEIDSINQKQEENTKKKKKLLQYKSGMLFIYQ